MEGPHLSKSKGVVYFVGAGPGDPGLITLRGLHLLRQAHVIVVDALVNPSLLRNNPDAKIIYVGKRGPGAREGASKVFPQKKINQLLISLAKKGHKVVRLKGGDPFVFGRGGEEMEALQKSKIPFQVVPGVTAAVAAPAYAGIPISDRRWASQVTFLTGHVGKDGIKDAAGIDWERLSPKGTTVVFMGVSQWRIIQYKLLKMNWPLTKPVTAIEWGTTSKQKVIISNLKSATRDFKRNKLAAPAVIIIGEVARCAKKLSWVKNQIPLLDKKIVVTRAIHQNQSLARKLEDKGADVIYAPAIQTQSLVRDLRVQEQLRDFALGHIKYDWIIFLSSNGVRFFMNGMGKGKQRLSKIKICAVGPQTKQEIERYGFKVAKMPGTFNAAALLKKIGNLKGKRIIIPRVSAGPQDVIMALKKKGAVVTQVGIYRTIHAAPPADIIRKTIQGGVSAVTFTSASTVKGFSSFFSKKELKAIQKQNCAISIGPQTTLALKAEGWSKIRQTAVATSQGIVDVLLKMRI